MEFDFLQPISNEILSFKESLSTQHLGSKIVVHSNDEFPNLEPSTIAFIGVLDNRGNFNDDSFSISEIRKQLYLLYVGNWNQSFVDLGDILKGEKKADTFYLIQKIVASLLKKKIIPIVIGGSHDFTYPLYRAYDNLEQMVNLVCIDNKFDFGKEEDMISSNSFLSKIVLDEPNNLFNFSNVGYQTYYNSQEEIELMDKLFFDAYRLGEISNDITIAEPVFRGADFVSIDMNSVKSSESGNFVQFEPNGFTGKEICSLARYSGISDKVSMLGIFNHNNSKQEAVLITQIIWYFIEGIQFRSNEYPYESKEKYTKYIVPIDELELIFYKSKSERWWIEIPNLKDLNNKTKNISLLPCTHHDYRVACNQEYPERWWKAQKKHHF